VCDFSKWNCFGDLGIHLMDGAWRVKMGRMRRRLAQKWEGWQFQRLLKKSASLGKARCHLPRAGSSTTG
jgi:hypothetical protein